MGFLPSSVPFVQNTDHESTPATSLTLPPLHATGTFSSGSTKSHGAKPKSEVSHGGDTFFNYLLIS